MSEQSPISSVYGMIEHIIRDQRYTVVDTDLTRPWGGFVRLDNSDAALFISRYFSNTSFETHQNLSPKFLLVAPGKRLSWQRHARRAEIWRVLEGPVGIKISETDDEPEMMHILETNDTIQFEANVRHRLIGLESNWGIVAEIWQHTDPDNPSTEEDITRIQDDFGR